MHVTKLPTAPGSASAAEPDDPVSAPACEAPKRCAWSNLMHVGAVLATVVVLLGFTMPAQPVDRTSAVTPVAAPAPVCDRAAVVNARLDVLDRAGYTWCIGFVPEGNWGLAGYPGPRDITVSETAPCDAIVTIINHEFIHTRQEALYPGRAGRA